MSGGPPSLICKTCQFLFFHSNPILQNGFFLTIITTPYPRCYCLVAFVTAGSSHCPAVCLYTVKAITWKADTMSNQITMPLYDCRPSRSD